MLHKFLEIGSLGTKAVIMNEGVYFEKFGRALT